MKKKTLFFVVSGMFLLIFNPGIFAQVSLSYTQPPPNQWKFADFWNVVITNTGNADQTIYLYGTLEESTEGKIAEATSAKFLLPKNYSGPLKTSWLQPVNQRYLNRKYEDTYRKTNTMPDGTYIICVTVYNAENKELAKDCIKQPIANMSPPELTYPANNDSLKNVNPVFQWMPPSPVPGGEIVTYALKIIELMDGQVPIESMEANPAFFIKEGIRSPYFQIPTSARPFQTRKSYAWQVTAYGKNHTIGKSQVWSFKYETEKPPVPLPMVIPCASICSKDRWNFGTPVLKTLLSSPPFGMGGNNNNNIYLTQPLTINNLQIVMLKAEIVFFRWYSDYSDCKRCTNTDYFWGNITGGSVNDPDFNPTANFRSDDNGNFFSNSHEVFWLPTSTQAQFNADINLKISIPPQTFLNCCKDCFRFCIRYTYVFKIPQQGDCIFCSEVRCYEVLRQHTPFIMPKPTYCGDPWYKPVEIEGQKIEDQKIEDQKLKDLKIEDLKK